MFIEHRYALLNELCALGGEGGHNMRIHIADLFILSLFCFIHRKNIQIHGLYYLTTSHCLNGHCIILILCKTYLVTGGEEAIAHH